MEAMVNSHLINLLVVSHFINNLRRLSMIIFNIFIKIIYYDIYHNTSLFSFIVLAKKYNID
jgi:hypothetical protein